VEKIQFNILKEHLVLFALILVSKQRACKAGCQRSSGGKQKSSSYPKDKDLNKFYFK
jgi:hypothetical protein